MLKRLQVSGWLAAFAGFAPVQAEVHPDAMALAAVGDRINALAAFSRAAAADKDFAVPVFLHAARQVPNPPLPAGLTQQELADQMEAEVRVFEAAPNTREEWEVRARHELTLGSPAAALRYLDRSLAVSQDATILHYYRAIALLMLDRTAEAQASARRALALAVDRENAADAGLSAQPNNLTQSGPMRLPASLVAENSGSRVDDQIRPAGFEAPEMTYAESAGTGDPSAPGFTVISAASDDSADRPAATQAVARDQADAPAATVSTSLKPPASDATASSVPGSNPLTSQARVALQDTAIPIAKRTTPLPEPPAQPAPVATATPETSIGEGTATLHRLGVQQLASGQYPLAERFFRQACAESPDFLPARAGLGLALWRQGQFEAAYEEFQVVLERRGDTSPAATELRAAILLLLQKATRPAE